MKTITIKASDEFDKNLIELAESLDISKSELIREAVEVYRHEHCDKIAQEKLRKAAGIVKQHRASIEQDLKAWEDTFDDGLEHQ